jgi:multicomponent Na+:H+ antiporter subunit G
MFELITWATLCFGSFWIFVAALGLVRLPDLFCRMHAATKASTLGLLFLFLGGILADFSLWALLQLGTAIFFVFLTNPIAAHLLSRNAMRSGLNFAKGTVEATRPPSK